MSEDRLSDAATEANWRDWQLEHLGLLDEGQPTESAHIRHRDKKPTPAESDTP